MHPLAALYGETLFYDKVFNYCPGCGHGIVTRLVAENIEGLGIRGRTVSIVGIGCGGFSHHYMNIDAIEAMHGRAPAMGVGFKTAAPGNIVYTYQGDGDMSAIGLAEVLHAANRGISLTCIMINNFVFGMTGGQMSPTSLSGQVTATSPAGRDVNWQGFPLRVPEMMRGFSGVAFLARETVTTPRAIRRAKKSIQKAFLSQINDLGFALVEVVVPCPTGLKMSVAEAYKWCADKALAYFKPQVFIDKVEQPDAT